jgi:hypothetical protein
MSKWEKVILVIVALLGIAACVAWIIIGLPHSGPVVHR